MIISLSLQDVTFLLRNKNVTSAFLLNAHNLSLLSCPLSRIELVHSPRVEFYAKKAIMVMLKNIKREFAYQTFIETIAGNHIECELKAVMDFIHYGLFEASKEKDSKAFSGIPLFCFNKQWLIKQNSLFHTIPANTIIAALGGYY